ncbi:MAG TPA: bifunctional tRNA pseudouridine(32) synthase/23S rRNA pseudouridine(746) synthase RluA [Marinospirillum sp.]|uniref:bifunctional tRNA pseudouridine(32) synthase/23S rRNA pseudouridine(746) synthase RluA n=1 Tax=Marinospirillum sp. TaxID=2183934 RepID=UPI002B4994DE|nr:bifunctional tRNA pseudouridine(32) synthase/23S rRNA pseudouridine(746) synthase RluA [Marinospirillum sp.]HKM14645.1 bifunctional tRNA pseudouridine(32) synthase/23S rRNA pseudouridine(746) synthase RluA [Marinospirillum sp.]
MSLLAINQAPPVLDYQPPTEPWLDILYQDKDILVVNKPAGLLSTPGRGEGLYDSVEARAKQISPYAELAHRLDMATSGVLVVALRKDAERSIRMQFQNRQTRKTYIAQVWGCPTETEGEINLPLICDWPNRPLQKVCHERGKPSLTHYRVIETDGKTSRLELNPITGRSHQLRVHLKALGHPILGDRFYSEGEALAASSRLLLHAQELEISHPSTTEPMTFTAPCPF